MTFKKDLPIAAGLTILLALSTGIRESRGQAAPAAPVTLNPVQSGLFQRLGITQSFQKVRDARVNRNGNNPQREAKPPLKSIADPANLQSPDPSVKAAALIKQDQDLAAQKIKAIKYLATQCCCCDKYKGTPADPKMALLASLDDCTEQVRYAAAQALCQCAGSPCASCGKCGCCDPKIMNKLNKMANGQDDRGCWLEPSERVRGMATTSLEHCRQVTRPTTAPTLAPPPRETEPLKKTPGPKEMPTPPKPYTEPATKSKTTMTMVQPIESTGYFAPIEAANPGFKPAVGVVVPDPTDPSSGSITRRLEMVPIADEP